MDPVKRLLIDQNFHHLLTSIFDRFGVVLGCHLGVIFALLEAKLGFPIAISCKHVIFQKTSAVLAKARFGRSEGPKIGPRRLQEALEEQLFRS